MTINGEMLSFEIKRNYLEDDISNFTSFSCTLISNTACNVVIT
jgi:hypothetical protein